MAKSREKKLVVDEYTDDYINERLMTKAMNKFYCKVGVSHTPRIGKKVKYKDANWMP